MHCAREASQPTAAMAEELEALTPAEGRHFQAFSGDQGDAEAEGSEGSSEEAKPLVRVAKRFKPLAPERIEYSRGSLKRVGEIQGDQENLQAALTTYQGAKSAATSVGTHESRLRWWQARADQQGVTSYPLTVQSLALAGSLLKAGGYRSAALYMAAFKREHIRRGFDWTSQLAQELTDADRAFKRGRGPDRQSGYILVDPLLECPPADRSWPQVPRGPALPVHTYAVSCFWLLREIEVSSARLGAVTFESGPGCGAAYWLLPVSKSDPEALGKTRVLTCACPSMSCPVRIVRELVQEAAAIAGGMDPDAPLSPTAGGSSHRRRVSSRHTRRSQRSTATSATRSRATARESMERYAWRKLALRSGACRCLVDGVARLSCATSETRLWAWRRMLHDDAQGRRIWKPSGKKLARRSSLPRPRISGSRRRSATPWRSLSRTWVRRSRSSPLSSTSFGGRCWRPRTSRRFRRNRQIKAGYATQPAGVWCTPSGLPPTPSAGGRGGLQRLRS